MKEGRKEVGKKVRKKERRKKKKKKKDGERKKGKKEGKKEEGKKERSAKGRGTAVSSRSGAEQRAAPALCPRQVAAERGRGRGGWGCSGCAAPGGSEGPCEATEK